jgi:hypothetical protein
MDPFGSYLIICARVLRGFVRGKENDFNSERVKGQINHPHNSKYIRF